MPPADMAWGTKKCLLKFDAWRGSMLIGKYKLAQASSCAKGLAEQYTEDEIDKVYKLMNDDPYWQTKGGADICDVANNIHKEIKKLKAPKKPDERSMSARPLKLVGKPVNQPRSSYDDPDYEDDSFYPARGAK